jgi:hypothetical protein
MHETHPRFAFYCVTEDLGSCSGKLGICTDALQDGTRSGVLTLPRVPAFGTHHEHPRTTGSRLGPCASISRP